MLFLVFFAPVHYKYSYSGDNCHSTPLLLPGVGLSNKNYKLTSQRSIGVIASMRTCLSPEIQPQPGTRVFTRGIGVVPLLGRVFIVDTPSRPTVSKLAVESPIPATKPLDIKLSSADTTHSYTLKINGKRVACQSKDTSVTCPLKEAKLVQGTNYTLSLVRTFKHQEELLVREKPFRTLTATAIASSSISPGATVYDRPTQITLATDKDIKTAAARLTDAAGKEIPVQVVAHGRELTTSWNKELARNTAHTFVLTNVEAVDGSDLAQPYNVPFKTSGGPTITNASAGKVGVGLSEAIVLTFDQEISPDQDLSKYVSFAGGTAQVRRGGQPNQAVVQLQGLPKCTDFTIAVAKGIVSKYGVVSESAWSYTARTTCHTTETIGYTQRGRAINAYFFGNGTTSVLYVGAIHGNEASASYILQDLIDYLEANSRVIPADKQVVIVPTINPDGLAARSRFNANGVNLNRNFNTADWKKDINDTGGLKESGGGSEPMSERETKAIAGLAARLRPQLVVSYHAVGSVVIANQSAGYSTGKAREYSSLVGYRNGTDASSEIFNYEITGTFDDWLIEKLGTPSIIVELGSYTSRNFSHHRPAMIKMLE